MNVTEVKNILPFENNNRFLPYASGVIIIISVLFTSILGYRALIILAGASLIPAIYNSRMNLIWILLALHPVLFYFSVSLGNIFGYLIALIFISLWISQSLLNGFKNFTYSKGLTWLMISLIFIATLSILPGGISRSELYTMVRILILFAFIIAFYDSIRLKDTIIFFVALSIPLVINSLEIFRIYLSSGSLLNILALTRLKPGGMFFEANAAGFMFLLSSPFWIAMSLWHNRTMIKIVSFAISFILVTGLILTNARASILGIILSLFFIALWKKKLKYYFGVIIVFLTIIISSPAIQSIISTLARVDKGVTSRDVIWMNTLKIIKNNPIFGIGIGNYSHYYDRYFNLGWDKGFFEIMPHAHNLILSKTAEMGIPGLIWTLFLYILPASAGISVIKRLKTNRDKAIVYGLIATFFGLYGQSLFEAGGMLQVARLFPDVFFWMLMAIIFKAKYKSHNNMKEIFK